MNGVMGMNELLLDTKLDDEQRYLAEQVTHAGETLLTIINDILDVAKIEAGRMELDLTDFNLHDIVEQACSVASLQVRKRGLRLDVRLAPGVPRLVHGDSGRFRQVLMNLLSNAAKFTEQPAASPSPSAPPANRDHGAVQVEVADTGIGIDPAVLSRMFEPFTQADSSTTRVFGGTGLGLSITRELVDLMGGRIEGASQPGRGSRFWFELEFGVFPVALDGAPEPATTRPELAAAGLRAQTRAAGARGRGQPRQPDRRAAHARALRLPRRRRRRRPPGTRSAREHALRRRADGLPDAVDGRL